jgi:hypothetical protein
VTKFVVLLNRVLEEGKLSVELKPSPGGFSHDHVVAHVASIITLVYLVSVVFAFRIEFSADTANLASICCFQRNWRPQLHLVTSGTGTCTLLKLLFSAKFAKWSNWLAFSGTLVIA